MKINKKKKGVFHADEGVDVGEPTPLPAGCRGEVPRSPLALHVTYHLTHSLSLPPSLPFSPKPHRFPHRSLLSFVISSFASHTLSLPLYILQGGFSFIFSFLSITRSIVTQILLLLWESRRCDAGMRKKNWDSNVTAHERWSGFEFLDLLAVIFCFSFWRFLLESNLIFFFLLILHLFPRNRKFQCFCDVRLFFVD